MTKTRRLGAVAALLLAATVGLTGCSMAADSDSGAPDAGYDPGYAGGGEGGAGGGELSGADDKTVDDSRHIIITGAMTITVKKPLEAASEAAEIVEQAGGHVDSRTEIAPRDNDKGRAELVLRIPATKVNGTLDALTKLGTLEQTQLSKDDVTNIARDLDARIAALQMSVDRLLGMMATATDTENLITIESALSQRQSDLESLQSQRASLGDKVDYSTITLHLRSIADAPVEQPSNFVTGLVTGWNTLVAFVSFMLVALGVILPWLIVPALVLLIVRWAVRRSRKKAAAAAAAAAAGAPARDDAAQPAQPAQAAQAAHPEHPASDNPAQQ